MNFIWAFLIGFASAYIIILLFGLWQAKNTQKMYKKEADKMMNKYSDILKKENKEKQGDDNETKTN